jgi:two-component system, NarL family, sensor kinase
MAARPPVPGPAWAVGRFLLGSVLAIVVVVLGGFFVLRAVTADEAERDTRELVRLQGRLVESAGLSNGVLKREPDEIAFLDRLVRRQILDDSIVRVKVWSGDGEILYADEPQLVGERFELGEDELAILRAGGAEAELSDLSRPENRFERGRGKLLEAYTAMRTPNGTPVLFEIYQRFDAVTADAERLLGAIAPPLLAGLAVLLVLQVPLAWSLARRLQRSADDRAALLTSAVEASSRERARIAADLHDGVVQDFAGVAFGLAPIADRASEPDATTLRSAVERLRQGVRDLRTLLVEIHPPRLESTGLEVALSDLLSPLEASGLRTRLEIDAGAAAGSPHDPLIYRVVGEALRNVVEHAQASQVSVRVAAAGPRREVLVADDGKGFAPGARERREDEGHLGLTLLEDVVAQAGGRLSVSSAPGAGTRVELEVPAG